MSNENLAEDNDEHLKRIEIRSTSITDEYDVDWNQKLGTGISGPVRLATKRSTGEKFAIKVVVDRPKAVQEVQMHWRCSGHPHVVSILEVFRNSLQFPGESESTSRLLLVLEYMDGGELFYRISKQNGFTERQAAATTMQIACAVQHLHHLNIAHRDLKPENLLYKSKLEDSPIKLCDFGFAKQDRGDLTTPQFTPYYVSPQVLEAQRRHRRERSSVNLNVQPYTYDKSCDMWSMGVIIYILMCGYPPFYSEHPTSRRAIDKSMRRKIMNGTYQLNEREWERVSMQAKDVVRKLLCVDPHERMTIDELIKHPWLTEEAPNTLLQSPLYISNKAHLKETTALYKNQLKKMRIKERSANLKPIESAINPMLVKRQQLSRQGESKMVSDSTIVESNQELLKPLRDIIAFCLFSQVDQNLDSLYNELGKLVAVAVTENSKSTFLKEVLEKYEWDGKAFKEQIDVRAFAYSIKDVIQSIKETKA